MKTTIDTAGTGHRDPCGLPASTAEASDRAQALAKALQACLDRSRSRSGRQAVVLGCLADLLGEPDLQRALDAFVAALQRRFLAERVTIALGDEHGGLILGALSGQAVVDAASAEVRLLLDALHETLALERTVSVPETRRGQDGGRGAVPAHRALANHRTASTLASVPLHHEAEPVGALLIERSDGEPFTASDLELIEHIALASAPLIALRREAARSATERAGRAVKERLGTLTSSDRPARAAMLSVGVAVLALAVFVPIERSVVAEAELVPYERRWIMAPIDGFIEEVSVTAGEAVVAGQVLARFDRRELDLELSRRDGEIDAVESELRAAIAVHDRKGTAVSRARLRREQAQRGLIEQRIDRSELRAPMDGVVISGDPSQVSGVPVARGDTLLEIAPAEGYDVHLLVDEADIGRVSVGQPGALALRTAPGERLPLRVSTIHPVGESAQGATRFRVRAELEARTGADAPSRSLRPGQSGVVRLEAGRESVATRLLRPLGRRLQALRWRFFG